MKLIEIQALPNGAHRNQEGNFKAIPEGYAQIPDDMVIPDTFPFVNIEVGEETRYKEVPTVKDVPKTREVYVYDEEGEPVLDEEGNVVTTTEEYTVKELVIEKVPYTVTVVTSMTAGVMPEPTPTPVPDEGNEPVTWNELAKAYSEGVNSVDE